MLHSKYQSSNLQVRNKKKITINFLKLFSDLRVHHKHLHKLIHLKYATIPINRIILKPGIY